MKVTRKSAVENSATRAAIIEATARLIYEEGYAAATSRRVGAKAGVRPPLIHYYFRTMDDLYAAVVRRMSEQALDRIEKALKSERPFQAVWAVVANPRWARFTMEFMALANQNNTVREVIAQQIEKVRRLEVQALARHLEARCVSAKLPLLVGPVLMTAASYLLTLEAALGVSLGHAETKAYVEAFLRACESGEDQPEGIRR
ncbi:MAG: TetR/AcrR family transcriptional regulator [Rhizomicrobium sp.]